MFRYFEQLSERTYIFPRNESPNAVQPNIGLITLENFSILIDAGNSPRHARQIMTAMSNKNFPDVKIIILTHHHWDHSFATMTYNPVQIIAHQETAKLLADYAKKDWSAASLREELLANPKRETSINAMLDSLGDFRDFRLPKVNLGFHSQLSLYFDNLHIDLEYVGGRHANDSIVVKIPEENVMFLGDCFYPLPPYLREEGDEDLDIAMLEEFYAAGGYRYYVDGHGKPYTAENFGKMLAWEKARQGV